jgi:hypothetical protein
MQLTTSWMLQGIEQGIERGQKSLLLKQIRHRFGELDEVNLKRIDTLTMPQLEQLGEVLLDCSDLTELQQWLAGQAEISEDGDCHGYWQRIKFQLSASNSKLS